MELILEPETTQLEHQQEYKTDICPPPFPFSSQAPTNERQRCSMYKVFSKIEALIRQHYIPIRHISQGNGRFHHIINVFIRPLLLLCERWERSLCWKCRPNFQRIPNFYQSSIDTFNQLVKLQIDRMERTLYLKDALYFLIFQLQKFKTDNTCIPWCDPPNSLSNTIRVLSLFRRRQRFVDQ